MHRQNDPILGPMAAFFAARTVETQLALLREAGFTRVEHLFRKGGTGAIPATQ